VSGFTHYHAKGVTMNITKLSELAPQTAAPATERVQAPTVAKATATPPPEANNETRVTKAEVAEVIRKANEAMKANGSDLKFSMDEDNGRPIVQIIDRTTEKVLRQIPSVEMLALSKALEKMQGVFVSKSA